VWDGPAKKEHAWGARSSFPSWRWTAQFPWACLDTGLRLDGVFAFLPRKVKNGFERVNSPAGCKLDGEIALRSRVLLRARVEDVLGLVPSIKLSFEVPSLYA